MNRPFNVRHNSEKKILFLQTYLGDIQSTFQAHLKNL